MAKEEREGLRKRGRKAARLLEDLSAFGPNQLASDMDSFLGDGSVFAKAKSSKFFDAVWQVRSHPLWFGRCAARSCRRAGASRQRALSRRTHVC